MVKNVVAPATISVLTLMVSGLNPNSLFSIICFLGLFVIGQKPFCPREITQNHCIRILPSRPKNPAHAHFEQKSLFL